MSSTLNAQIEYLRDHLESMANGPEVPADTKNAYLFASDVLTSLLLTPDPTPGDCWVVRVESKEGEHLAFYWMDEGRNTGVWTVNIGECPQQLHPDVVTHLVKVDSGDIKFEIDRGNLSGAAVSTPSTLATALDYLNAPAHTVIDSAGSICEKRTNGDWWGVEDSVYDSADLAETTARVLRWGSGK